MWRDLGRFSKAGPDLHGTTGCHCEGEPTLGTPNNFAQTMGTLSHQAAKQLTQLTLIISVA